MSWRTEMDRLGATGTIERAKALYSDALGQDFLDYVGALDPQQQDYVWAYVYVRMNQIADTKMLRRMSELMGEDPSLTVTLPDVRDAEVSTHPSSYFGRAGRLITGGKR